jgi:integrase
MRAIHGYSGNPVTTLALKLAPLVFVRPGELRAAEWPEFDLENTEWCIPGERMKMGESHLVPLSRQARRSHGIVFEALWRAALSLHPQARRVGRAGTDARRLLHAAPLVFQIAQTVSHTEQEDTIRIFSARRANAVGTEVV